MNSFAKDWREKHAKKWLNAERLGGFCLLVKRAVLNKIGAQMNEWSDLGLFDSDILSAKAREAGFAAGGVPGFVHPPLRDAAFVHGG